MKRFVALTSLAFVAAVATNCATVPDNAPAELKSADQAIKQAKEENADDTAPKHIQEAQASLKDGVKIFKDADGMQARVESSKAYGNKAKELADQAIDMHNNVKAWDKDGEGYKKFKSAGERVGQLETELAAVTKERDDLNTRTASNTPSTAISNDGESVTGAAWFETASANPSLVGDESVQRIVQAMSTDADLKVSVMGYADRRGSKAFNKTLSEKRAEAVSAKLQAAGIAADRIEVVAKGNEGATEGGTAADLQRDRRVDLQLTKVAH